MTNTLFFEIMANIVLCIITNSVRANRYYSILVDEATDISFKEQVSICIHQMDIHEDLAVEYLVYRQDLVLNIPWTLFFFHCFCHSVNLVIRDS